MEKTRTDDASLANHFDAEELVGLEEAYRRWAPLVHSNAYLELRQEKQAEHVPQGVFVTAWNNRAGHSFRRGSLGGWLVALTRRQLLAYRLRTESHPGPATELDDTKAASTFSSLSADGSELDRLVVAALVAQLPEPQGALLRTVLWEGCSCSEIAAASEVPVGTVVRQVGLGLLHLRDHVHQVRTWLE